MTKAVIIVNASNGHGEDVEVAMGLKNKGLNERRVLLKPGSSLKVMANDYENVRLFDANPEGKNVEPIKDSDGKQVFPLVKVQFQ